MNVKQLQRWLNQRISYSVYCIFSNLGWLNNLFSVHLSVDSSFECFVSGNKESDVFRQVIFINISCVWFFFQPTRLCSAEVEVSHNLSGLLAVCAFACQDTGRPQLLLQLCGANTPLWAVNKWKCRTSFNQKMQCNVLAKGCVYVCFMFYVWCVWVYFLCVW